MVGARSLQFAWFPETVEGVNATTVYTRCVGKDPDTSQINKVPTPSSPFLSSASGKINGTEYNVRVNQGRIDLFAKGYVDPEIYFERIPNIDFEYTMMGVLNRIQDNSMDFVGSATRLSIVATLCFPSDDRVDANRKLIEFCSLPIEPDDARDLSFQFNKRKQILESIEINRINKYQVEETRVMAVQVDGNTGAELGSSLVSEASYSVLVTLDYNTVPTGIKFSSSEQKIIFGELARELNNFAPMPSVSNIDG
ncbi:hypothetical protein HCG46_26035 [Labrenzia sp. PO1]|uniref:hypothetical protein n=1 Tax=Labrenzia sp. PO1 TaxID=2720390 RepID=UPI00144829CD|nr:hypothetical protein [Labrenzia sp. PO1]NKI61761.1 hypothetical protein [Labrenzia sp. PO1]